MVGLSAMGRILSVLIILVSFSAFAADEADKAYWLCKHRKEVRTIRVHINTQNICSTFYSKLGEEKIVGSGKNHESCMNFMLSIKSNLEKSNWTCRDISDTKITSLE
jgi:hypothetical protein